MATSAPMVCAICDAPLAFPEKRLYGYNVCGSCHGSFAMKRALAYFVDVMIFSVVAMPVFFFVLIVSGVSGAAVQEATRNESSGGNMAMVVFFSCMLGFIFLFLAKDGFGGHSPAKAMFGLQVIDERTGRAANFWDSFQRNLPPQIPLVQWYVLYQLLQYDGKRLGDGWSRTKVIWKPHRLKPLFLSRRHLQAQLAAKTSGKTA